MSQLAKSQHIASKPASPDTPRVSAFMACYNAGEYLQDAVESVLKQSHQDFEFVIVNDGSTDDSATYLNSIEDHRVRVIHQENRGLGRPLNEQMRKCRGEYIMRLDADDICHPDRMKLQLKAFDEAPELVMLGSYYQNFYGNEKTPVRKLPTQHEDIVGGMLKGWHTLSHGTVMFRRELLNHMEGYLISGAGEDWSLLLDASRFGKLGMVPEPLYLARLHPTSNAWRYAEKVWLGFEFAKQRHLMFLETGKDLSLEAFMQDWKGIRGLKRIWLQCKARSSTMHRQAVIDRLTGKKLVAAFRMLGAVALDPAKTVGAIWKRLKR